MKKQVELLVVGVTALWVVAAWPARCVWGEGVLVQSGTALLVCLMPAAGTMILRHRALHRAPEQQLLTLVAGMGLRMAVVLGAAFMLHYAVPELNRPEYGLWLWLIVFYLATLGLEIALLVQGRAAVKRT